MKTKLFLLVSGLILSSQLQAAPGCTSANLNGNYTMYQNTLTVPPVPPHTGVCKVNVNNGVLSGTCAFTMSNGSVTFPGFNGPVTGSGSINADCSATLNIDFVNNNNTISSVFNIQFTPDKQSFIGSWSNSLSFIGTSSGTRYTPAP